MVHTNTEADCFAIVYNQAMPTLWRSKLGWPLVIVLSVIPAILWALSSPSILGRFIATDGDLQMTYRFTMTSIGQLLGLVGMGMFAVNFVLATRAKWLEDLFGGMNKVYIAHHILGGIAFVLLLFHPLFLSLRYLVFDSGLSIAANLFLFSKDPAINFGIIGLGLMQIFLILTFFVNLPYPFWKFTHKFLGLAFFFASLHVLFIDSDVTYVKYLQWYMWFLVTIGFISILYRTILGYWLIPTRVFRVSSIRNENSSIREITLEAADGKPFDFHPGQFIFISFPDIPGLEESHPFSISSAPNGGMLTLGIKALGDFTKDLGRLTPGARAIVEGPFGRTSHAYMEKKKQVWIAGGIGITPFLGMARSFTPENGYEVDLYYSLIDRTDQPFVAELEEIARRCPNLRFIPWFTKESGFLSAEDILKHSNGVADKDIILCGPSPMMKFLKEQFKKWDISSRSVHSEEFALN
jgi:predicted ferric reductase